MPVVVENHAVLVLAWGIILEAGAVASTCMMWMTASPFVFSLDEFHGRLIYHFVINRVVIFRLLETLVFPNKSFSLVRSIELNKRSIVIAHQLIACLHNADCACWHLWVLSLRGWWKGMSVILVCFAILVVEYLWSHLFVALQVKLCFRYIWIVALSTLNIGLRQLWLLLLLLRSLLHLGLFSIKDMEILFLLLLILCHVEYLLIISVGALSLVKWVNFVILSWLSVLVLVLGLHQGWRVLLVCYSHHLPTDACLLSFCVWMAFDFTGSSLYVSNLVLLNSIKRPFVFICISNHCIVQMRSVSRGWTWIKKTFLIGFRKDGIQCMI